LDQRLNLGNRYFAGPSPLCCAPVKPPARHSGNQQNRCHYYGDNPQNAVYRRSSRNWTVQLLEKSLNIVDKIGGGSITASRFLLKGAAENALRFLRQGGQHLTEMRARIGCDRVQHGHSAVPLVRRMTSQHFIVEDAKAPNVSARIYGAAQCLLWRHIVGSAYDTRGFGQCRAGVGIPQQLRDAKV